MSIPGEAMDAGLEAFNENLHQGEATEIQHLRKEMAQAWEQGHNAGLADYGRSLRTTPNPYRAAGAGE